MSFRFRVTQVDGAFEDGPAQFFVEDGQLILQRQGQAGMVMADVQPMFDAYQKNSVTVRGVITPGIIEPLTVIIFSSSVHTNAVFKVTADSKPGFFVHIHVKVTDLRC